MITIILFILIGLKLEVGVAYWCLIGISIACRIMDLIFKIVLEHKKQETKKEIDKHLDEMLDKLKKQRGTLNDMLEELKKEEEEEAKNPFAEIKDVENWRAKQEETKHEQNQ